MLTRRPGETLILQTKHEEIHIHFDLNGKQIKVGIDAPRSVSVIRAEIRDRYQTNKNDLDENNDSYSEGS